ncbi:hypothetical protein ACLOJK_023332 [Asimina triloba]
MCTSSGAPVEHQYGAPPSSRRAAVMAAAGEAVATTILSPAKCRQPPPDATVPPPASHCRRRPRCLTRRRRCRPSLPEPIDGEHPVGPSKSFIMITATSSPQIRRGRKPTLIAAATRGESSSSVADEPTFIPLQSPISLLKLPKTHLPSTPSLARPGSCLTIDSTSVRLRPPSLPALLVVAHPTPAVRRSPRQVAHRVVHRLCSLTLPIATMSSAHLRSTPATPASRTARRLRPHAVHRSPLRSAPNTSSMSASPWHDHSSATARTDVRIEDVAFATLNTKYNNV